MSAPDPLDRGQLKAQCDCDDNNCTATGSPLKKLGGHRKGCICNRCVTGRPVVKTPIRAKAKTDKRVSRGRLKEGSAAWHAERKKVVERSGGLCEIRVDSHCTHRAVDPHHVQTRARSGSDYAENLLAACRSCHDWIEANQKEAHKRGWLKHSWEGDPSHLKPVPSPVRTAPKTTANTLKLQSMSEKDFQQWVVDLAHHLKWVTFHVYDSRRCTPGFPDLVLIRDGRLVFAELKREKGRVTPEQEQWLTALGVVSERNQTVEKYLWRPSDRDEIEAVLQRAA